ncbi:J domain-containing protein [Amylibacter sp. IMCC11727]|uniref:J domain-containing protein n=1 Tax=Amylibacter sp. IMCC11727 TaxID=3039851 RepID=UPI00244E0388|nr:J domain-containing protein [Amylibacter sp. IMCC11727]WGI21061.1 J domain-containing protein [Amylibacter sp. IMCC11727]
MAERSPFDFDISVSADKKRRAKGRRGMSGAFETSSRQCQHDGCNEPGKYRAPKHPDNLEEFYWFCLTHIREFNSKWNFFENHSEEEMEKQFAADRVWDRDTKPFGDKANHAKATIEEKAWARLGIEDPTEVLGANATRNPGKSDPAGGTRRLPAAERKAIDILEARDNWTKAELRKQYKKLIKELHPDMNGGDRSDEDRLQQVVWAWDQIKNSKLFK